MKIFLEFERCYSSVLVAFSTETDSNRTYINQCEVKINHSFLSNEFQKLIETTKSAFIFVTIKFCRNCSQK